MDSKENAKNAIEKLNLNPIFSDGSRLYVDFSPPDYLSINETHESKGFFFIILIFKNLMIF